jgi:uncharacterized coiled-coil protein SlyX
MVEDNELNPEAEQNEGIKKVAALKDKLSDLGLDMNTMFMLFQQISENTANNLLEPKIKALESSLTLQVRDISKSVNEQIAPAIQFIESIQKQLPAVQSSITPNDDLPPGPGVMQTGARAAMPNKSDLLGALLQQLLPQLMGGQQSGSMASFDGMIAYANKIAEFNRAINMTNLEMQQIIKADVYKELGVGQRLGVDYGVDEYRPVKQLAAGTTQQPATFSQQPDYKEIAIKMAKNIRIVTDEP